MSSTTTTTNGTKESIGSARTIPKTATTTTTTTRTQQELTQRSNTSSFGHADNGQQQEQQQLRVCRQYIKDRITGNSYVPKKRRRRTNWHNVDTNLSLHQLPSSSPHTTNTNTIQTLVPVLHEQQQDPIVQDDNNDDEQEEIQHDDDDDVDNNNEEEENEDPMDCMNRPPHYLCRPPPCVATCPKILEQNQCCRRFGQIGFHQFFKFHHITRRRLLFIGFTFNFISLLLTLFASLAFSKSHTMLHTTSFARGRAQAFQLFNNESTTNFLTLNIGFRAIAFDDPYNVSGRGDHVVLFDTFCGDDAYNFGLVKNYLQDGICGDCVESSQRFVVLCVFNLLFIFRNMFSDINRMYPKYDLNCLNCTASIMGMLSVFLGLYTITIYRNRCFNNFENEVPITNSTQEQLVQLNNLFLDPNTLQHNDEQDVVQVQFEWWRGPGLFYLAWATILRFVDALCNCIVPTPTITRSRKLQHDYEVLYGTLQNTTTAIRMTRAEEDENHHNNDEL